MVAGCGPARWCGCERATSTASRRSSASDHASVQPAVQGSRESRGAAQDALSAFASPQLRDSSARARQGHSRHSGVARTREVGDDGPLHPRGDRNDCQDRKPAGGPERAAPQAYEAGQCGAAGAVAPPAMARPALEVADILRDHGPAWREANRGHVSLEQLKVMSAIERCRTAALGGHVARCENAACGYTEIAYNSCRNRHCPKCQGAASRRWLVDREAELLPVPYFHVVYTLPSELRDIAYQNKRVIYDLLMKAAAETTLAIASDPKRLGARIGVTAVLHSWGSALTHHPHVHMIVPGGGLSLDGTRWVASRSNFLVHVNLLARLFRGKMLAMLTEAYDASQLTFFNTLAGLADKGVEERQLAGVVRLREHGQHLAAEQARQQVDMHEEVGARGDPSRAVEREPSTRHDHVHVRMMGERRAPAVQHGGDTDPRPKSLGVACDGERRLGRRLHQQVVDHALVLVGDITQLARQGVHDVKVRHR